METARKGFTLIELLIVIGILAVLATITVLVLNPAQLFAQARDSQRISDLGSMRNAISLYLTTVTGPSMNNFHSTNQCGSSNDYWASVAGAPEYFTGTPSLVSQHTRAVDGTGWVPIDLTSTTGGAPLSALPVDPVNSTALNYTYQCDDTNKTFELNAIMESARYANGGADDVESTDGGPSPAGDDVYEVGTDPGLDL